MSTGGDPAGERPAFVYLPGLDGSAELLFMQHDELARRYHVLLVPWRTECPFEYGDLVTDVIGALDREGVERATIFAESFGGTVALLLALEHPQRVERLVVLNSFSHYPNRHLVRLGLALARTVPFPVIHGLRAAVAMPTLAAEGIPPEARRRFVAAANRQPLPAYARRLELVEAFDLRGRLHEIRVPSLFIAAERDRVVPPDESRFLAERVPNAALRILPGVGHASLLTPGVSLAHIIDEHPVGN